MNLSSILFTALISVSLSNYVFAGGETQSPTPETPAEGSRISAGEGMMIGSMASSMASMAGENETAQYLGAGVNIATGGKMVKDSCKSEKEGGNSIECAMGAMMVAQGGMTASAASKTGDTKETLGGGNGFNGDDYPVPEIEGLGDFIDPDSPTTASVSGNDLPGLAKNILDIASSAGVTVSPDGSEVTIAGKGTFPSGLIGSKDALVGAGFNEGEINGMFDKMDNLARAAQSKIQLSGGRGIASGGGSASGGTVIKFEDDMENPFAGLFGAKNKGKDLKAKGVSGLQKILPGGDVIGVAQDNIFEMIHRRYKIFREKKNFFVEP